MKGHILKFISAAMLSGVSGAALAGVDLPGWTINGPASVPVDSPWAIAGIGAVVAVVAARILINRRK